MSATSEQEANKASRHKVRQQKVKAAVDARIASAQIERGVLMVITGDGKGKTTGGFGTVARAVGHGQQAAVVQFIKGNWDCGERNLLENAGVPFAVMATGFTWETQDKEADTAAALATWQQAEAFMQDKRINLVLLDELTYMVSYHYLPLERVVEALENRPKHQHVIITGRNCHRQLIEMADTVSEVKCTKHAFNSGIAAQPGFDF
ncbi:cob(I)yrinic acid a,c-diamide adenosyltransferase [Shewanella sp. GXUN23E]|uniref:cob(I)yrinic acid a,c-diamide adenosyltransferase n=1 Tax=Shewanella sp. GXUN23E TaxID=3422498 RepID=UPI003D7C8B95